MKKITVILATLALCTPFCSSALVLITKTNGGTHGYKSVRERHNGSDHSLTCEGGGNDQCSWTVKPPALMTKYTEVEAHVTQQLTTGTFSGTWNTTDDNNDAIVVSWSATSLEDVVISIQ